VGERPARAVSRLVAALAAAALLAGCEAPERRDERAAPAAEERLAHEPSAAAPVDGPPSGDTVVARIGDQAVTAAELDATMPLALHDLDRARYELRAARLRDLLVARVVGPRATADSLSVDAWLAREAASRQTSVEAVIAATLADAGVTLALGPPPLPVVEVSADDDAVRGAADAPVTIVEFVDYASPYCRRMQPALRRLLDELPAQLRLVVRDLPLPVHRDGALAAEAAECAGEQDAYWPYSDVLLQEQASLGRDALVAYAGRVELDVPRFTACLDGHAQRAEVDADLADARRLGLSVVPTTFVNGRYLRGPQTYETLRAVVDAELAALGVAAPPSTVQTSGVAAPSSTAPPTTTVGAGAATTTTAPPHGHDHDQAGGTRRPPSVVVTLPAARVAAALADRPALARDLEPSPVDDSPGYEGRALVRVERVPPGGLYALMGLQPGDVLIHVDGTLVLDDGDALFDALGGKPTVTVQVLRRGLPETFEYRLE